MIWLMERYSDSPQQKVTLQWLRHYVSPGQPGAAYLNRVLGSLHPNVRRRYLAGFIGNLLFRWLGEGELGGSLLIQTNEKGEITINRTTLTPDPSAR